MSTAPGSPTPLAGPGPSEVEAEVEAAAEARARVRRGRFVTAVVVGALVVVLGVVALCGGFGKQAVHVTDVALGAPLTTGPFEVTLTGATVTHHTKDDVWVVETDGTIRATASTSEVPMLFDDGFVFAALGIDDQGVGPQSSALYDGDFVFPERDVVAPGVPAVPWHVSFEFPTAPPGEVLVGVYDQEYKTKYLFDDELVWQNTKAVSKIVVPLEQLPDDTF